MSHTVRRLFLFDSLRAANSALMLGIVSQYFPIYFGIPKNNSYTLAICALFLTIFSGTSFLIRPNRWRIDLWVIEGLHIFSAPVRVTSVSWFASSRRAAYLFSSFSRDLRVPIRELSQGSMFPDYRSRDILVTIRALRHRGFAYVRGTLRQVLQIVY